MAKIYVPYIKITCPEFFTVWTYMFIIHIYIHEFTSLKKNVGVGRPLDTSSPRRIFSTGHTYESFLTLRGHSTTV